MAKVHDRIVPEVTETVGSTFGDAIRTNYFDFN